MPMVNVCIVFLNLSSLSFYDTQLLASHNSSTLSPHVYLLILFVWNKSAFHCGYLIDFCFLFVFWGLASLRSLWPVIYIWQNRSFSRVPFLYALNTYLCIYLCTSIFVYFILTLMIPYYIIWWWLLTVITVLLCFLCVYMYM